MNVHVCAKHFLHLVLPWLPCFISLRLFFVHMPCHPGPLRIDLSTFERLHFELNSVPVSCITTFVHLSSGGHLRQQDPTAHVPGFLFPFWVGANFNRGNYLSKLWKPHAHQVVKLPFYARRSLSQTEWRRSTSMSTVCGVHTACFAVLLVDVASDKSRPSPANESANWYHRSLTPVAFMNGTTRQGNKLWMHANLQICIVEYTRLMIDLTDCVENTNSEFGCCRVVILGKLEYRTKSLVYGEVVLIPKTSNPSVWCTNVEDGLVKHTQLRKDTESLNILLL